MTLPLVLLGGAEPDDPLRTAARSDDRIWGYKGVRLSLDGEPLLRVVGERFRATGLFDPIFVAGPAHVYAALVDDDTLIDTDSGFGANIRTSVDFVRQRHPDQPLALATIDLVPKPDEIAAATARYHAAGEPDFWTPLVPVAANRETLGPFASKPTYRVADRGETSPAEVLPSHLVIARPDAVRTPFFFNLLDVAYQTRETSVMSRRNRMLRHLLPALLVEELRAVARFRAPTQTVRMVRAGLAIARDLRSRHLALDDLETHLEALLLRPAERGRGPGHRAQTPLLAAMSLALDADTHAQAEAMGLAIAD